ncbi:TlpA family protein disulfide reductase [Cytobacillus purgationiresistens]|uniref:Thiol-disulfide isomerase/thioredoxin n=1 Tax=Cytobacillus purgationiresistens TaxID=863449 RepID=A0ABU0ARN4_9BACI|nr:TlpA disulfide reductase family protein [Cytobacillus purgationiresistens]MDQ0273941.1 thiol-disulfide isomerase/thioredoxin [Cytobacillus purgationiresistens]
MLKNIISLVIIIIGLGIVIINIFDLNFSNNSTESNTSIEVVADDNQQNQNISLQKGATAPDFELTTLDGQTLKLSDCKGKKVILNFWASWCPPCIAELPHMENFYQKNKEAEIEIVAVNLTNLDKGTAAIEDFVDDYYLSFPIPLDKNGDIGLLYQAYSIPTSYIIDSKGVITQKLVGPMDESMMESLTNSIE